MVYLCLCIFSGCLGIGGNCSMCSSIKFNDKEVLSVCSSDMLIGQSRLYVKQLSMKILMPRYLLPL